ncbi:MAG: cobalamin adenosyltransferase [Ignavibacteriales bacterium]
MKVLTEMDLRAAVRAGTVKTYRVSRDTIVTPSARSFMAERGIELVVAEGPKGQGAGEKPEFMTHLRGNDLVPKTHPRIRLRGLLDLTQAFIIQAQVVAQREGITGLVDHLGELLEYTRQALRAEVLDCEMPEMRIMGMSPAEIREMSHNPSQSIGIKHILPSYRMGEVMSLLNIVRTQIRQAEIAATEVFWPEPVPGSEPSRLDILQALNRLSSAAYVMMCRLEAGAYTGGGGR